MRGTKKLDFAIFAYKSEFTTAINFSEYRQRSNWGPGQCFAPQMGSSVCEHQCGSWQGLRRGMGRLQWHMLQFKLSLDPCSSGGPAGAQGGIHYNQTQAGLVSASIMTPVLKTHLIGTPFYSHFTCFNKM